MRKVPLKEVLCREELETLYHKEEMSARDIAEKYGYSKKAVLNLMNTYLIKRRDRDTARFNKTATAQKVLTKEILYTEYVTNSIPMRDISRKYNIQEPTIIKLMKKYGINSRGRTESLYLRWEKEENVSIDFFKNESSDLFYILGLIASDGYIMKDNSIGVNLKDKDVIEWVHKKINCVNPVKTIKPKGKESESYVIKFKNRVVGEIIRSYGITEKKSLTLEKPSKIPDMFVRDYIRGVFDGDGTICSTNKTLNSYKVGIVSASKEFILWVKSVIDSVIGKNVTITYDRRGNGLYMYYFSAKKNIVTFGEWLYGDNYEDFGMSRKKKKFIEQKEASA